jgi:hypothetical protein
LIVPELLKKKGSDIAGAPGSHVDLAGVASRASWLRGWFGFVTPGQ